ncbi:MAG TPA: ferrous iron transport protein B [Verrucomicrobiae bacterium]
MYLRPARDLMPMDPNPNAGNLAAVENPSQPAPLPGKKTTSAACIVLTGNPNSGKTTIFNALTGLRARVGNYAGVTVERKEGRFQAAPADLPMTVLDLPGTYSLSPQSLDEQIARDVLLRRLPDVPAPAAVVIVVDASNLERNLFFATQVIELGYPTVIALNMTDVAEQIGHLVDPQKLAAALGTPVIPMVASTTSGIKDLQQRIVQLVRAGSLAKSPKNFCEVSKPFDAEVTAIAAMIPQAAAKSRAVLFLSDARSTPPPEIQPAVTAARERLEKAGIDWRSAPIEARYARIDFIQRAAITQAAAPEETTSDKLDRILTHKFWGMLIFVAIMAVMFVTIFTIAQWPMDMLQDLFTHVGDWVGRIIPPGDLQALLVKGVILGVGAVVVFLPQICLLFLFIGLLEDTGYMARAAFLMDRLMSKVGLHGKSFIPMLSSFACAIPGIMATRTIETPKDRLVTILVAPLMSCSARLPVYTLLIAACMPHRIFLESVTMLSMYLLGIVVALAMAWLLKKTLLKGETPMLIMELPPYKRPLVTVVLRHMWDRSKLFLRRAGTVILGINILLWFLASYPYHGKSSASTDTNPVQAGERLRGSFAGMAGHWIEPTIKPLGFDWKIGIGIISSFAAREVFVSTMSVVYNVAQGTDEDTHTKDLAQVMSQQKRPDGTLVYTTLTSVTLMVFYVLALQCVSTVAVVRRETNSWKWPLFQWVYMGALAWIFAFVTYQGGKLFGLG